MQLKSNQNNYKFEISENIDNQNIYYIYDKWWKTESIT